ncbi:MAG TPA: diacylglycerol kinase family protein [Sporichthya sp.]|nr:diacylglycerol kinase family protein [Sporichthya sp.]
MRLKRLDVELYDRWQQTDTPRLDRVLPPLSRAADHGVLWLGLAGALWASGRPGYRRAAMRGLGGLALASAVTNGPAKWLIARPRPAPDLVSLGRRLLDPPHTSSFPSGHSASAAAFATGVALEKPLLGVPVGALGGAVALSRIHTGVHYPGDVAAGVAIGALASYAVRRAWPPHKPADPVERAPAAEVPASADGSGVIVVLNASAGAGADNELTSAVRETLPAAEIREVGPDDDMVTVLREAAATATVLGVAGGDGTINSAAEVALAHDLPLLVIPGGTLNHFARDVGLKSVQDALDALRAGEACWVDVGGAEVDGTPQVFLNTASLGGYSEMVRARERLEERLGKWPAMVVALVRVLRKADPVEVDLDGRPRRLWLLFLGNCVYSPPGSAPSWRDRLDDGRLDVRLVDATRPFSRTRLIGAVLIGRLDSCPAFEAVTAERLEVDAKSGPLRLSRDGEVGEKAHTFRFGKGGRLRVYRAL